MKKYLKSKYLIGTVYYSLPSLLSIIISLISIPIFLKILTNEEYASYLMSHFILTIAIITNLSFNKITTINIAKKNSKKKDIIFTSILLTSVFSTIFSLIIYTLIYYSIQYFNLENIKELQSIKILIGLIITNFYLTLEGIFKGNINYKTLSLFNLFFYSISMSLPSVVVYYKINIDILTFSILIKLFVIATMFAIIIIKLINSRPQISKVYIDDCKNYLKWMTLNIFFNQVYNYFDKYIIKIFLDNVAFVFYNISQQITSKFSSPMMGYNNIFIAKTNVEKKDNKNNLSMAAIFYCVYMLSIFLMLYLFLQKFLIIWLGSAYSTIYYDLIKIFFLIIIMNSFSSLLTDFYDLIGKSNFNSYVEVIILLPFIIGITLSVSKENIYYFVYTIFFKELLVLGIKFYKINYLFLFKSLILIQFLLITLNSILWFTNFNGKLFIIIQILHLIIFLPYSKIKKFYKT